MRTMHAWGFRPGEASVPKTVGARDIRITVAEKLISSLNRMDGFDGGWKADLRLGLLF